MLAENGASNIILKSGTKTQPEEVLAMSSQNEQDKLYIEKYMPKNKKGYFIEIGGADGIKNSNTLYLEEGLKWDGLCVEANPKLFKLLDQNRCCNKINAACGAISGDQLEFVCMDQFSSFLDFAGKYRKRLLDHKKKHPEDGLLIPIKTLTEILEQVNAPTIIDFFSLDVEGAELEVLTGLDFEKYKIDCILVEHNSEQPKRANIRKFLQSKNYYKAENLLLDDLYKLR